MTNVRNVLVAVTTEVAIHRPRVDRLPVREESNGCSLLPMRFGYKANPHKFLGWEEGAG